MSLLLQSNMVKKRKENLLSKLLKCIGHIFLKEAYQNMYRLPSHKLQNYERFHRRNDFRYALNYFSSISLITY